MKSQGVGFVKSRLTLVSDWGAGGSQGSGKGDFLLRNLLSNLMFLELFLVRGRGDPFGRGVDRGGAKGFPRID